jgi:hypothetical protein
MRIDRAGRMTGNNILQIAQGSSKESAGISAKRTEDTMFGLGLVELIVLLGIIFGFTQALRHRKMGLFVVMCLITSVVLLAIGGAIALHFAHVPPRHRPPLHLDSPATPTQARITLPPPPKRQKNEPEMPVPKSLPIARDDAAVDQTVKSPADQATEQATGVPAGLQAPLAVEQTAYDSQGEVISSRRLVTVPDGILGAASAAGPTSFGPSEWVIASDRFATREEAQADVERKLLETWAEQIPEVAAGIPRFAWEDVLQTGGISTRFDITWPLEIAGQTEPVFQTLVLTRLTGRLRERIVQAKRREVAQDHLVTAGWALGAVTLLLAGASILLRSQSVRRAERDGAPSAA